ncbi:uncharacterized protein LOC113290814 [Papaver somniferum]|uniref:uncharacterized protein LOC113290814 n=1 Tax=Papaver somniferum TaxID=3469 RepID=UPI000E6FA0D3|nr:uncharacterized protein LOC113290814 [Papaver somniferum]
MIEQFICTVATFILLNGALGEVYLPQRGLRQGDLLFTYLFILIMEYFSRSLNQLKSKLLHGFKPTKTCLSISHLFFVDDCLIFIKARNRDARNLVSIIDQFSKYSGHAVKFENSVIAFSSKVPNNVKIDIVNILQIRRMALLEKYLGVSLLLQKSKTDSFNHLVENYKGRLDPWKSKYIAQPGKFVLNQTVIGSMTITNLLFSKWHRVSSMILIPFKGIFGGGNNKVVKAGQMWPC